MKWKLAALASTAALILCLLFLFAPGLQTALGFNRFDQRAVLTQVKQLNRLVTVEYSIQRVVGVREQKEPLGEESILILVQGQALAGVDLNALSGHDIQYSGTHSLEITLPPAKLFNTFLDEKQTKVWDRQITWWTPWVPPDPDLEHKARLQGLDDIRNAALAMGILGQAQKNAEVGIRDLFSAAGIQTTFKIRPLD